MLDFGWWIVLGAALSAFGGTLGVLLAFLLVFGSLYLLMLLGAWIADRRRGRGMRRAFLAAVRRRSAGGLADRYGAPEGGAVQGGTSGTMRNGVSGPPPVDSGPGFWSGPPGGGVVVGMQVRGGQNG